jgi:2-polyprenyl-3-methyl-5-hydroxy-6-metoxy-1,4-benzoquinol methylase
MFSSNTDKDWEQVGRTDPYFGVVTHDKFRCSNLTEENKGIFFRSGHDEVNSIVENVKHMIDSEFTIKKALDFGCGVGRLLIPLSDLAETATGIDVSESMLNEAKKNCKAQSINNVILAKSDDTLSCLNGKYDFIYSFVVFQHIPVPRGERIFKNLIDHLEDGGICVAHFTYSKESRAMRITGLLKNHLPLVKNFVNMIKGRGFSTPQMQMNDYNLNRLFAIIQRKSHASKLFVEYTNHNGTLGVIIYFMKPLM